MTAASNCKMGIMLSSSGPKNRSYQLTYESTVIQPRNIERLFAGGGLHVLGCREKSTAAAFGDTFVSLLLAVSDHLQDKVQKGPSLFLLDLLAVHALA